MVHDRFWIQCVTTAGGFFAVFLCSIHFGWSSPNVARFSSGQSPIQLTSNEISWMVSLFDAGGFLGSIFFSTILEFVGSRRTVLIGLIVNSTSWISLMFLSYSIIWLYIFRLLSGLAMGGLMVCTPIYLGEVVQPKIRGTLISIVLNGSPAGVLFAIIMETYITSMKVTTCMYLALSIMIILLFVSLRDSPYYFVKFGDLNRAKESLTFYFPTCDVEEALIPVKEFIETTANKNIWEKIRELKSPVIKKSLFTILIIYALPHLSGYDNMLFYLETIVKRAKLILVKPSNFVIYVIIVTFTAALLSGRLSDKFGRRVVLILTSIGSSIGMVSLGLHFYLLKENIDAQSIQWLPVFSIICYSFFYGIGYASIPSIILSELFPENIKSFASFLAMASAGGSGFIVSKLFLPIVEAFGEACVFWIHAGLSLLSIAVSVFLLPETKGKTLDQIQKEIMKR